MPALPVPIDTLPLFDELNRLLLELLRSLTPEDWQRPTLAREWTVKDVAAHLLDGNLRTLSMLRDGFAGETSEDFSYRGLVTYLNRLNADWVRAARRLSPAVLIELLEQSGAEYTAYLTSLDPWGPAPWPVAWAGERESRNWFHIARDYTEKWHHQQQIRATVGQTAPLLEPRFFRPFIETMMRGLPHAYRNVSAPVSTRVRVVVSTNAGGAWELVRATEGWHLQPPGAAAPAASIALAPVDAWPLFTKGLSAAEGRERAQLTGDVQLALPVLQLVAVMG